MAFKRSTSTTRIKTTLSVIAGALLLFGVTLFIKWESPLISRGDLRETLGTAIRKNIFPTEIEMFHKNDEKKTNLIVQYTLNNEVQKEISDLIARYKPDYGAFVALETSTGKVVALSSFSKNEDGKGNLALKATFPAASVFKVVTAAAAIDQRKVNSETIIPFNGRSNTLYKQNVRKQETNRWTRFMTLKEAFGRSVNTVFGKLGVFYLGPNLLKQYAYQFGFNREIDTDLPVEISRSEIDQSEPWSVVEAASGFTRKTKMSPLHGALIAAAAANNGITMEPYIVDSVHTHDGEVVYKAEPKLAFKNMAASTAAEVRDLMQETVKSGTSRGSFRTFFRRKTYSEIEVGGKTGTLNGDNPRGRCDWFVGYADFRGHTVAFAALTVHKKYWTVKSSYLARRFVEDYFEKMVKNAPRNFVAKQAGEEKAI